MAKRRGRYGDGSLYQRGGVWWIKSYIHGLSGRRHYETTEGPRTRRPHRKLLDRERGQQEPPGRRYSRASDRVTYAEAAAASLRTHYEVTGSRDLGEAELRLTHLDAFFSGYRLAG